MKYVLITIVFLLDLIMNGDITDPYKLTHIQEMLDAHQGNRIKTNFKECQEKCVIFKKYTSIFPQSGQLIHDDNQLNKMTPKWLKIQNDRIDVFEDKSQKELEDGEDLSGDVRKINPPEVDQFLNEYDMSFFTSGCNLFYSPCNKEQFEQEVSHDNEILLNKEVDKIDKKDQAKRCILISGDMSIPSYRQFVICHQNIFEIVKLKFIFQRAISVNDNSISSKMFMITEDSKNLREINLLFTKEYLIGNNVYTMELEKFEKSDAYKEYFRYEYPDIAAPAAFPLNSVNWSGDEKRRPDPRRGFGVLTKDNKSLKMTQFLVYQPFTGDYLQNIDKAQLTMWSLMTRINNQVQRIKYQESMKKANNGDNLCYQDIQNIAFRLQGKQIDFDSGCQDVISEDKLDRSDCKNATRTLLKNNIVKVCKKNIDCYSKLISWVAGDQIVIKMSGNLHSPQGYKRSYLNQYGFIAQYYGEIAGLECIEHKIDNCDPESKYDIKVKKMAQQMITEFELPNEVIPNCPQKLNAPEIPQKLEVLQALNTFRSVLGTNEPELTEEQTKDLSGLCSKVEGDNKKLSKEEKEKQAKEKLIKKIYFYIPFFSKYSTPYLEYLQFFKNVALKPELTKFYFDFEKTKDEMKEE